MFHKPSGRQNDDFFHRNHTRSLGGDVHASFPEKGVILDASTSENQKKHEREVQKDEKGYEKKKVAKLSLQDAAKNVEDAQCGASESTAITVNDSMSVKRSRPRRNVKQKPAVEKVAKDISINEQWNWSHGKDAGMKSTASVKSQAGDEGGEAGTRQDAMEMPEDSIYHGSIDHDSLMEIRK